MEQELVKVGDLIYYQGKLLEIRKIISANYWPYGDDKGWMIEFESQYGYGYWKQYCDGGKLLREVDYGS